MAHEKLRPDYLFDETKIAQLKQLAPECFEDGKINFTTLSQNLGDWRLDEEDPKLEHFGLFWPGKRDARKAAALPPEGTLEPVWGDGLKSDGTPDSDGVNDSKNIFIEGENLEVLKLLQKSYAGKIKMIYIDPPYNTGNDFVYDDDFTEPLQEYLRRTGQVDEEGKAMTTNKRSDGRFHSKWLCMMYPRLRLARNLLRDDGVIFVSIDDNELSNLSLILNEVFGPENFLATFIIQSNPRGSQSIKSVASTHEYLLTFAKNFEFAPEMGLSLDQKMQNEYNLQDAQGYYRLLGLRQRGGAWRRSDRPS
ncbi:MAG: site-specific DNA-methyltransferase, partial [Bacteroidetes bacterium]|nr:site-specific DNA-methyltransferase [Bacteroidota bacterium]